MTHAASESTNDPAGLQRAIAMASRSARRFLLVLLGALAASCGGDALTNPRVAALEVARARWAAAGLSSYSYALRRRCFCPPDFLGPARLRIESGVVVEQTYVESNLPVPTGIEFPTVDELFEILGSAYEQNAHEVTVTYHPDLGVPLDFWIDYDEMAIDEELGAEVTEDVTALP